MPTSVLFVCLGNICRSPLAEGVFRHLVQEQCPSSDYTIDSAGTGGWHAGSQPHEGSIDIAEKHGIDISGQQSRQVLAKELSKWDWVIAMDNANRNNLLRIGADPNKTKLLLSFIPPGYNREVPDPYYDGGFDRVYELIEQGCSYLLDFLESENDTLT
ncbi:MAG: phosphotyrosine protein phosphatase [Deltaproteobacteria bacterium]|nr:phosphotyrosine protein phosphatase [Deltaproteobacteria bacterium]|tara:strand:- start:389 stop:862 length:474 start_codon:yes stop_codon:yes gene_type:complete